VNYDTLLNLLRPVDWSMAFANCVTANDYAELFTTLLRDAITASTCFKVRHRRKRLPPHIVSLLRKKRKAWVISKRTGNRAQFVLARRTAKAAIKAYQRNTEQRLIYSRDKTAFFSHVYGKTGKSRQQIHICVNGDLVSDAEAASIFSHEFASNYSVRTCISLLNAANHDMSSDDDQLTFNCTEFNNNNNNNKIYW
jgi:hypothetical protein